MANGKKVPTIKELSEIRRKRSADNTEDDFKDFLRDMYPGVEQAPTQMVQMMASPQIEPDDQVESSALFHAENVNTCDSSELIECPKSFHRPNEEEKCIHRSKETMTIADALNYCWSAADGYVTRFLRLELLQDTQFLSKHLLKGIKGIS